MYNRLVPFEDEIEAYIIPDKELNKNTNTFPQETIPKGYVINLYKSSLITF
jgi:hypothetical protein